MTDEAFPPPRWAPSSATRRLADALLRPQDRDARVESARLDAIVEMAADSLAPAGPDALPPALLDWVGEGRFRSPRSAAASWSPTWPATRSRPGTDWTPSPRHASRTGAALRTERLSILEPELRLFAHGGGGARRMTMPLRRGA